MGTKNVSAMSHGISLKSNTVDLRRLIPRKVR